MPPRAGVTDIDASEAVIGLRERPPLNPRASGVVAIFEMLLLLMLLWGWGEAGCAAAVVDW